MSISKIVDYYMKEMTCSQVLLMIVAEEMQSEVSPDLIKAMDGLHTGIGGCMDVCGVLTSGACVLASYAGTDGEERRNSYMNGIIQEYYQWFEEYNEEYGSNRCEKLIGELKINKMTRCLEMIDAAYQKIIDLLDEYDLY